MWNFIKFVTLLYLHKCSGYESTDALNALLSDLDIDDSLAGIVSNYVDGEDSGMTDAERMLSSSYSPYGYQMMQSYHPQTYPMPSYTPVQTSYQQQQQTYVPSQDSDDQHQPMRSGYGQTQKPKKIYVPVVIRKKKQKKRKTIAVYKGFYIPGGTQVFGKFKKVSDCKKVCEVTPNCFAADYNKWLKKCYVHTNITACDHLRSHPKLIHFKKVPCDLLETPRGLITLGAHTFGGLVQKGIKSLQDCIKKCATAGSGIAATSVAIVIAKQTCFGVDYDFGSHKCYFLTNVKLCPAVNPIPTPVQLVSAPSVINILLCPLTIG